MDFLDDIIGSFTNEKVLSAVIPSVIGVGAQALAGRQQDKLAKDAMEQKRLDAMLALDLEELKLKYGAGGGGGGGGGADRNAQLANLLMQAAQNNQTARNANIQTLSALGRNAANNYLGR